MILSDKRIKEGAEKGDIIISEFDEARINPASYDVLLGDEIAMYLPKIDFEEMKQSHGAEPEWGPDLVVWTMLNKFLEVSNSLQELLDNLLAEDFTMFYQYIHDLQEDIIIDPQDKTTMQVYKFKIPEEGFIVQPGYFYLYSIKETVGSNLYASEIKNKSSVGRISLLIHFVASWIDVGFVGNITLEVASWLKVILRPNMKIGQLIFHEVTEVEETYDRKPGSKYMNQEGVTGSKYDQNYK